MECSEPVKVGVDNTVLSALLWIPWRQCHSCDCGPALGGRAMPQCSSIWWQVIFSVGDMSMCGQQWCE